MYNYILNKMAGEDGMMPTTDFELSLFIWHNHYPKNVQ